MGATITFPTIPYKKTLIDWHFETVPTDIVTVTVPILTYNEYLLRFRAKLNNEAVSRSIGYLINGDVNTANLEGYSLFYNAAVISTFPIGAADAGVYLGNEAVTVPNKNFYFDGWIRFYRYQNVAAFIEIESLCLCRTITEDSNTRGVQTKCTYSAQLDLNTIIVNTMGGGAIIDEFSYALMGIDKR